MSALSLLPHEASSKASAVLVRQTTLRAPDEIRVARILRPRASKTSWRFSEHGAIVSTPTAQIKGAELPKPPQGER